MIQRIQTVFLFLAIIALAAFNVLPYWQTSAGEDGVSHQLMSYGFSSINNQETSIEYGVYAVVAGISLLAMIIILVEIFKFKNRVLQLKLAVANSLLMSVNLLMMTYLIMDLQETYQGGFGVGIFIYALAMILNVLARRFIQKDENLVRSVDRLR